MSAAIAELATTFALRHARDAASVLESVEPDDARRVLARLDARKAFDVLHHMGPDAAARVLDEMQDERAQATLSAADFVRLAIILAHLDENRRTRLLELLTPEQRRHVAQALEYPPGCAGQLMDPRVVTFREQRTTAEVLGQLRRNPERRLADVLVVDDEGKLSSVVPLQVLVAADGAQTLASLPGRRPLFVEAMATRDEVVELLQRHRLSTLPVVDLDGRVLGVLRHDALLAAAQHAATDDLQQMVGANKDERALSTPSFTVKSRLPWLIINLGTGFLAAAVVGLFDQTIATFTALAVLMPVVAGQAGNTGAQSLAVVIRGLALREIRLGHAPRVLRKEALAALINGSCVALLTSLGTYVWSGNGGLTLVIGVSMVGSMFIAALAGATVPMVLTALDRDPATASSIVLTTVTDIAGFSSFLGLATLLSDLIARGT
jgi:magnesium transporter